MFSLSLKLALLFLTAIPVATLTTHSPRLFSAEEKVFPLRSNKNGNGTAFDPVWQVNLEVRRKGQKITLTVVPEAVTSGEAVVSRPVVDSALRELTYIFRDLGQRAANDVRGDDEVVRLWRIAEKPVITGLFRLSIRKLNGTVIFEKKKAIWFGPARNGKLRVYYRKKDEDRDRQQILAIDSLNSPQGYGQFLEACTQAFETERYPLPEAKSFIVELSFRYQDVNDCKNNHCETELGKYLRTWIQRRPTGSKRFTFCLGTTLCRIDDKGLTQFQSPYWKHFGENVRIKKRAKQLADSDQLEEAITVMKAYFDTTPSDRHAARLRLHLYDLVKRREQAYPLVADYQPYFLEFREPNQLASPRLSKQRAQIKQETSAFALEPNAWLHINKPLQGDLIAGPTAVELIIKDNHQPILSIDAFLDEKKVDSIESPPVRLFIDPPSSGNHELEVVAYFEDRSYCSDKISLKSIRIDESEAVHLIQAQVSATRFTKPVTGLEKQDFKVKLKGRQVAINRFSKQAKPLEILVLIDSSISMAPERIVRARHEVLRFLQKLPQNHATAVYSFESRVIRLKGFDQSLNEVAPLIQTINADGGTALYDALLTARGQLLSERDTVKVLIVLTDGGGNQVVEQRRSGI